MQTSLAKKSNYVSGNFQSDCFHSICKYSFKNYTINALDAAVMNIHTSIRHHLDERDIKCYVCYHTKVHIADL